MPSKSKQLEYLRSLRYQSVDVSEASLCRDLLYVFQGIDGTHISYSILEEAFVLAPNVVVSASTKKIVQEMCELGWLYKKVNDLVQRNMDSSYSD